MPSYRTWLLIADVLALCAATLLASPPLYFTGFSFLVFPVVLNSLHLYASFGSIYRSFWMELVSVTRGSLLFSGISILVAFFQDFAFPGTLDKTGFLLWLFIVYGGAVTFRLVLRILSKSLIKRNRDRVLVVGTGDPAKEMGALFNTMLSSTLEFSGFVSSPSGNGQKPERGNSLGKWSDLPAILDEHQVKHVFISGDQPPGDVYETVSCLANHRLDIQVQTKKLSIIADQVSKELIGSHFMVPFDLLNSATYAWRKRALDLVFGSFLLVCFSPVLLLTAIFVKLSSRGPVFYLAERVGKGGRPFKMIKFRSMFVDETGDQERRAEMVAFIKGAGKTGFTKIVKKGRITRLGKFLRKTSIDELPQLINVLKGEMSIVGPRPAESYEYEHFEPWQKMRVKVLPGITGLWQVVGRSETSFEEMIILDLYYCFNANMLLDLEILLKTFPAVIYGHGGG